MEVAIEAGRRSPRAASEALEGPFWVGDPGTIATEPEQIAERLQDLSRTCYIVQDREGRIGATNEGAGAERGIGSDRLRCFAAAAAFGPDQLGDRDFLDDHGVRLAYYAGSMANGISSEELVIALGGRGILASFGAGGLLPARIQEAIGRIRSALPAGPYASA